MKHAPQTPLEEGDQLLTDSCWYSRLLYSNLLATSTFIETPGFYKKKFWNVNFYISHMHVHSRMNRGLFNYIKQHNCNRRLVTGFCALTFFLMIFFRNSGKPLLKFSFTNSSPSTFWSFLNPSAQKKKLKYDTFYELPLITTCLWGCIMREISAIQLKWVANKISSKISHVFGVYAWQPFPHMGPGVVHYFS